MRNPELGILPSGEPVSLAGAYYQPRRFIASRRGRGLAGNLGRLQTLDGISLGQYASDIPVGDYVGIGPTLDTGAPGLRPSELPAMFVADDPMRPPAVYGPALPPPATDPKTYMKILLPAVALYFFFMRK